MIFKINMKTIFVLLNVIAAIVFIFLGSLATAIHKTHSYSVYREFVAYGLVDEEKLKAFTPPPNFSPNSPQSAHYDMPARLHQIGDAQSWFMNISYLAAAACVFNASVIYFSSGKRTNIKVR